MTRKPPLVTDHALLRYLERVYGVDIEGLRRRIEKLTAKGRAQGASGVKIDGVRYAMNETGHVVTIHGVQTRLSSRAKRWRRRRGQ